MDMKKGRKPTGQTKAPTRPIPAETKTDAHADLARGKDPKEPPTIGTPPRHTPGATK